MSKTGITVQLLAVDQTAAAVQSARSQFAALSQSIVSEFAKIEHSTDKASAPVKLNGFQRLLANVALFRVGISSAAAVARAAWRPFGEVARQMHDLSDRAAECGASASEVLRLSQTLGELGIKASSVNDLTAAIKFMRKATGDSGTEGFKRQLANIAKLNDAQERATELVRVFGRAGAGLEPLLRAGPEAFLHGIAAVESNMPVLSASAAQAATAFDVGIGAVLRDIKGTWTNFVLGVLNDVSEKIGKPVETTMQHVWETVKTYLFAAMEVFAAFALMVRDRAEAIGTWIGEAVSQIWRNLSGIPRRFIDAWKGVGDFMRELGAQIWNALTGRGFDWDAVVREAADAAKRAATVLTGELQFSKFDFEDHWGAAIDAIAGRLDREGAKHVAIDAAKAAADAIGTPLADISDTADDASEALAGGASKVSNALKPSSWTDAASYAAATLSRSAAVAAGLPAGRLAVKGTSSAPAERGPAPLEAISKISPIVAQILAAVKRNGEDAKSFFAVASNLGVV